MAIDDETIKILKKIWDTMSDKQDTPKRLSPQEHYEQVVYPALSEFAESKGYPVDEVVKSYERIIRIMKRKKI